MTELLVKDLVAAGCMIVSGFAIGVDAVSAQATTGTGGKTIAVLESGGAIISENPVGMIPNKGSFPARNRGFIIGSFGD